MTPEQAEKLTAEEAEALLRRRRRAREKLRERGRVAFEADRMMRAPDMEAKADADR